MNTEEKKTSAEKVKKIQSLLNDNELERVVGGWGYPPETLCPECGKAYLKVSHEDDIPQLGEYASYCPNCSTKDENGNIIKKKLFTYGNC